MNWSRIIVYVVLIVAGIGLLLLRPGIERRLAEVEALLADADQALAEHESGVFAVPGHPDEYVTAVQTHRMSYLAVIKEKRFQRHSVLVVGPALIGLGLVALCMMGWQGISGRKRKRKPARHKRPRQRRKAPPRGKTPAGRPRGRRGT